LPQPPVSPEPAADGGKAADAAVVKAAAAAAEKALDIWKRFVLSWLPIERQYSQSLRVFFLRQQRLLLDKLKKAIADIKSVDKADSDRIIARVVFDLKKENNKLKVINNTFFEKASDLGLTQAISEITGLSGEALAAFVAAGRKRSAVRASIIRSSHNITAVNTTTQNRIARTLTDGLESGEDLTELSKRLKNAFGLTRSRAQLIARTQTAGAVNSGRHAGFQEAGVRKKSWITAGDGHVRPAHVAAGSEYAAGIAIEEPFIVGGESLMFPADPAGSAANIINCRCLQIARMAQGKSFDLDYYSHLTFATPGDVEENPHEN